MPIYVPWRGNCCTHCFIMFMGHVGYSDGGGGGRKSPLVITMMTDRWQSGPSVMMINADHNPSSTSLFSPMPQKDQSTRICSGVKALVLPPALRGDYAAATHNGCLARVTAADWLSSRLPASALYLCPTLSIVSLWLTVWNHSPVSRWKAAFQALDCCLCTFHTT